MRIFGLIGRNIQHSFSPGYFNSKFKNQHINDCIYRLFELDQVGQIHDVVAQNPELCGLNVTMPFKQTIVQHLDEIDDTAKEIGAVNTIKITQKGKLKGYNTDWLGFYHSLVRFIGENFEGKALILGSGGASKAVQAALSSLRIPYCIVSTGTQGIKYEAIDRYVLESHHLIINCTPVGMYPKVDVMPEVPIQFLSDSHYVYDLIYNPELTLLLQKAHAQGAHIKNGLEMLHLQAEFSWEIWNSSD